MRQSDTFLPQRHRAWNFMAVLTLAGISGCSVMLVPLLALAGGTVSYICILIAYGLAGSLVAITAALIGTVTHDELHVAAGRILGFNGQRILAAAILMVSLPASVLTGGLLCGYLTEHLTGLPHFAGGALVLVLAGVIASGRCRSALKPLKCLAVLFIPLITGLYITSMFVDYQAALQVQYNWDWFTIAAFVGYSAGGMRVMLLTEAGSTAKVGSGLLTKMIVGVKALEALIALAAASVVIRLKVAGPLALSDAAGILWGHEARVAVDIILLGVFAGIMVPAMLVNGRGLSTLTGLPRGYALILATLITIAGIAIDYSYLLRLVALGTVFTALILMYFLLSLPLRSKLFRR